MLVNVDYRDLGTRPMYVHTYREISMHLKCYSLLHHQVLRGVTAKTQLGHDSVRWTTQLGHDSWDERPNWVVTRWDERPSWVMIWRYEQPNRVMTRRDMTHRICCSDLWVMTHPIAWCVLQLVMTHRISLIPWAVGHDPPNTPAAVSSWSWPTE